MKRRHHTPEQIVDKLSSADRLLGNGQELPAIVNFLLASERRITAAGRSTAG